MKTAASILAACLTLALGACARDNMAKDDMMKQDEMMKKEEMMKKDKMK